MAGKQLAATATLITLLGACGGAQEADRLVIDLPEYTEDGLRLVHSDTDDDGRPDVFKYFEEEEDEESGEIAQHLVRTEIDLNNDGIVNMRRTYNRDGELQLEEMDGNLDGRMDHIVFWELGLIVRSETDEDHDGDIDEVRQYREGFLNTVLRDTDRNGAVDTWSYYDRDGLSRIGYDTDGDGEADRWSQRSSGPR